MNRPSVRTVCRPPAGLADELREKVEALAGGIGQRNCYRPDGLEAAAEWIEQQFAAAGLRPRRLPVHVPAGPPWLCSVMTVWNIEATKPGSGRADEVIVVGSHYDSRVAMAGYRDHGPPLKDRLGTPGADDNASGVAATLTVARMLADRSTERSIRFVAFVNEEPPFFQTPAMGSRVYARAIAANPSVRVIGMISPDSLGCYSYQSMRKRIALASVVGLPDRPDYVAFLSNRFSRRFSRRCAEVFGRHSAIAVRSVALPALTPRVGWSDDWSFWQEGIPAFNVTDTGYLRYDHYHEISDTPDRLDYPAMAEVVWGLRHVIESLANPSADPECP